MIEPFEIRALAAGDCDEAARLRFEAPDLGFLPLMGERFYAQLLRGTIAAPAAFGAACTDADGRLAGFVIATVDCRRYPREVLVRQGLTLVLMASARFIRHPRFVIPAIRYAARAARSPRADIPAEWLTMMVSKDATGRGIGTRLTRALIDEYRRRGVGEFKSTVAASNTASCTLHEKFGFEFLGAYPLAGEATNLYRMVL